MSAVSASIQHGILPTAVKQVRIGVKETKQLLFGDKMIALWAQCISKQVAYKRSVSKVSYITMYSQQIRKLNF